jgi:hypothetical protein
MLVVRVARATTAAYPARTRQLSRRGPFTYNQGVAEEPIKLDYATPQVRPSRWWWLLQVSFAGLLALFGALGLWLGVTEAWQAILVGLVFLWAAVKVIMWRNF